MLLSNGRIPIEKNKLVDEMALRSPVLARTQSDLTEMMNRSKMLSRTGLTTGSVSAYLVLATMQFEDVFRGPDRRERHS